ncbi:MAG: RidA family protein [Enterobacteriaceae bacterium]
MSIRRLDPEQRWSEAVIHNQTLYYTGVPENLSEGAQAQMENVLQAIDTILARAGSDKTQLLDVTIFLADKNDFAAMNVAWDNWVVSQHAPVRCTVHAGLMNPGYKMEVKIIAACA